MLDDQQISTVRMYRDSLRALLASVEAHNVAYIHVPELAELDEELTEALARIDFVALPKWDLSKYLHSQPDANGAMYERRPIVALTKRVLARMEAALLESVPRVSFASLSFPFIANAEIRAIVERDFKELVVAEAANCQKSALILAGSCIEGVVFDLIEQNQSLATAQPTASKNPISRWTLGELMTVANALKLLPAGVERLSGGLKDHRNLVHPAVEVREKLTAGAEEARIAIELLKMLHRDLSQTDT